MSGQLRSRSALARTCLMAALLAVVASLLVVVNTSPAAAATRTIPDRANDVNHGMDIRRVRVANQNRLVVLTRHEVIQPDGSVAVFIDTTPRTSNKPDYILSMNIFDGVGYIYYARSWRANDRNSFRCDGASADINRRQDTTRFAIPRGCISGAARPAGRVRVAAAAAVVDGADDDWAPGVRRWSRWVKRY